MNNLDKKKIYAYIEKFHPNVRTNHLFMHITKLIFLKYIMKYADRINGADIELIKSAYEVNRNYEAKKLSGTDISCLITLIAEKGNPELANIDYESIIRRYGNELYDLIDGIDLEFILAAGNDFFECLQRYFWRYDKRYNSATDADIIKIVKNIFKINSDDTFMDLGSGLSSTYRSLPECNYVGYEKNQEIAAVSAMIFILLDKKREIKIMDYRNDENMPVVDNIFLDASDFMLNIDKNYVPAIDINYIMEHLKDGGTAVISLGVKYLYSSANTYYEIRQGFIRNGLKMVVTLPITNGPTGSGRGALLVFEKKYEGDIKFIDGDKLLTSERMIFAAGAFRRENDDINKMITTVCSAINCEHDETGLSMIIDRRDVIVSNSLVSNTYKCINLQCATENRRRSINEIDIELNALYEQLNLLK